MASKKRPMRSRNNAMKRANKNLADLTSGPEAGKVVAELQSESSETRSAGQSGSMQGLSDVPKADSEGVNELLEEGNAFEAEIVKGVEDTPDADQGEVKTHEVPEDDVPAEYRNPEQ